jgi:hypothetical protein
MKKQREGQRARKRRLRSLERADSPFQGDAERVSSPEISGGLGADSGVYERWAEATRTDLVLLRRAVREGWPIPEHVRSTLVAAIRTKLAAKHHDDPLMALAVVRAFIAMDCSTVEAEIAQAFGRRG